MTTSPGDLQADGPPELRLGHDAVRRMRLPGPPPGRPLPTRIGSLASSVSRFAAATSRPVDIRRALVGPDPRGLAGSTAPPRWWIPQPETTAEVEAAPPAWLAPARPVAIRRLPERGLPRAARAVQDESTYTPGGIVGGLRGEAIRVRRLEEVAAVGPMLTQHDRARLSAARTARPPAPASAPAATQRPQPPPSAPAQSATSRPPSVRRSTRAPRQSTPGASAPAGEAPTDRGPTASPTSTDPASPGQSPTASAPVGAAPGSGGSATVSAPGSIAGSSPVAVRRAVRAPWQLRSERSRFGALVRRTPATPASSTSTSVPTPGLPTAERHRPPGTDPTPETLRSSVRPAEPVAPAGPGLIAGDTPTPSAATVRRHAWAATSVVQRQAAESPARTLRRLAAPGTASAPAPAPTSTSASSPASAQPPTSPARAASTSSPALPSGVRPTETVTPAASRLVGEAASVSPAAARRQAWAATSVVQRQAADSPARTLRRLPAAAAPTTTAAAEPTTGHRLPRLWDSASDIRPATDVRRALPLPGASAAAALGGAAAASAAASSATTSSTTTSSTTSSSTTVAPTTTSPGISATSPSSATPTAAPATSAPTVRRLPRLWRRSSDIQPAADVRRAVPAPITGAAPAQRTSGTSSPAAPSRSTRAPSAPSAPTAPSTPSTTSAPTTARPAAAGPATSAPATVRRYPTTRIGAHVPATTALAPTEVSMPELMTVRRMPAHGGDPSRPLATAFSVPEVIRPSGSGAATAPSPAAAASGQRLWRRPAAAASGTATTVRRTPAGLGRAAAPAPAPSGPGRTSVARPPGPVARPGAPGAPGPASAPGVPAVASAAAFTAASATTAPDLRRFTVAPPRVSVSSQRPAPPVPASARSGSPDAPAGDVVRRTPAGPGASLVEATAHLFARPEPPGAGSPAGAFGSGGSVIRRAGNIGGNVMPGAPPPSLPGSSPQVYGSWPDGMGLDDHHLPNVAGVSDPLPPGIGFDALVDAVVQRIERKVIEEMERRGRWPGGELY